MHWSYLCLKKHGMGPNPFNKLDNINFTERFSYNVYASFLSAKTEVKLIIIRI